MEFMFLNTRAVKYSSCIMYSLVLVRFGTGSLLKSDPIQLFLKFLIDFF